jgi:hypothetical protein
MRLETGQMKAAAAFDSYLLAADSVGGLRLFDLADPANPLEVEGDDYLGGDPVRVTYNPDQNLAYVSSQIAGLFFYDVSGIDQPAIDVEGRWVGEGSAVGISAELDQARGDLTGTITVANGDTFQGIITAAISNNSITGTINYTGGGSGTLDLMYNADGTLSGTIAGAVSVPDAVLTYAGERGLLALEDTITVLNASINDQLEDASLLDRILLPRAQRSLQSALASDDLSGMLTNAGKAASVLSKMNLKGTVAAANASLYPSAYWEMQIAQTISQDMADSICSDYQWIMNFLDGRGDEHYATGIQLGDAGDEAGAMRTFSRASRFYERVSDRYGEFKPQCPEYGVAAFDGYYEGTVNFGIVLADLKMCVSQAADGTVTGEAAFGIEASGEFQNGTLADCVNTGETESVLTGTIEVVVGEITAHLLMHGWQYNLASGSWEGTIEVVEQSVTGTVSLTWVSDDCPPGWNAL